MVVGDSKKISNTAGKNLAQIQCLYSLPKVRPWWSSYLLGSWVIKQAWAYNVQLTKENAQFIPCKLSFSPSSVQ
jgi:hypothetical protein